MHRIICRSLLGHKVIAGWAIVLAWTLLSAADLQAQGQLPSTVQLPVFRNFFYQGAIKVPDGGSMHMGGVTRSAEGSVSRGVPGLSNIPGLGRGFNNRGIGREQEAGNLTATAKILIQQELEAEHLAKAGMLPGQRGQNDDVLRKAAFLTEHMGRNPDFTDAPSKSRDSWGNRR